jgi:CBS domain-containing protein
VASDDKMLHAMSVLSGRGCHRIPVLDAEGSIKKLITQYSMIEYLYKHRTSYAQVFGKTVSFFGGLLFLVIDGSDVDWRSESRQEPCCCSSEYRPND